jgi:hypothetical protein
MCGLSSDTRHAWESYLLYKGEFILNVLNVLMYLTLQKWNHK